MRMPIFAVVAIVCLLIADSIVYAQREGGASAPREVKTLPDAGKMVRFDFSRDPLGAKKPMQTFEETMAADEAARKLRRHKASCSMIDTIWSPASLRTSP